MLRTCAALLLTGGVALGAATSKPAASGPSTQGSPTEVGLRFAGLLSQGRWADAQAMAAREVANQLSPATLERDWAIPLRRLGRFERFGQPFGKPHSPSFLVYVPCEYERGRDHLKLVLSDGKIRSQSWTFAGVEVPTTRPAYLDPDALEEKPITVGQVPWLLPGKLTVPASGNARAAVVLVHGSGPSDEDGTLFESKPYRDLAWGLAGRGIATLRYVKRTQAHPMLVKVSGVTLETEVIDDAMAAIAMARSLQEVQGVPLYLVGHSLGGMLAPEIAKRARDDLAGIVLLAAPGRPAEDGVLDQFAYSHSIGGVTDEFLQGLREQMGRSRERRLRPYETVLGAPVSYWYDLCERSGAAATGRAAALKCRMLILQGGRDYQVTQADFAAWKAALASHSTAEFHFFENLNHLFASGRGMASPSEYMTFGAYVDAAVIDVIAEWCLQPAQAGSQPAGG